MALLGELGVVERCVGTFEVGATVLLVGVEEEGIEPPVEVVVAGYIVPGTAPWIELPDMPEEVPQPPLQLGPPRQYLGLVHQDGERVSDRALFDDEGAFHVDFAERELGVQQHPPLGVGGQEPGANRITGPVAAGKCSPPGVEKGIRPAGNKLLKEIKKKIYNRNNKKKQ